MPKNRSVLLVDDVRAMRMTVRSTLRSFGMFDVTEASNGEEALSILAIRDFDLVITDLVMQPMDGIELTRKLRTPGTAKPSTPILILSGYNDMSRVSAALAAGAASFLVKPVVPADLKARVESLFAHRPKIVRTAGYHGPDRRRRPLWVRNNRRQAAAHSVAALL